MVQSRVLAFHFPCKAPREWTTKSTVKLGPLDTQAIAFGPWFAMTPDGKSILYVKEKPATSDIMLVKNFR
jgi:hypothetical protein